MKNNKILLCILIIALLLFSFSSCNKVDSQEENYSTENTISTSNTVRVTFPEGFTVSEIANKLEENNVCSASDFMSEANNTGYLTEFGIEIENPTNRAFLLEGYLFPDTYEFYVGENPSSVIKRFLRNYNSKVTDEMKARAKELGYSIDEILTLASIIQEEAGNGTDDSKVSSVLHNRLNSNNFSKLQCDCTTFYLKKSVMQYVSEERYEELLQLYSTYKCKGLPEGAISNPGMDCINSALYPDETNYYFFVTDNNNVYYYSETWEEHQENCTRAGIY